MYRIIYVAQNTGATTEYIAEEKTAEARFNQLWELPEAVYVRFDFVEREGTMHEVNSLYNPHAVAS